MLLKDTFDACATSPYNVFKYIGGNGGPNFSLPSLIGEVIYLWDGLVFEIHIEDIDPRFEMRKWFGISKLSGTLYEYTSEDLPLRR